MVKKLVFCLVVCLFLIQIVIAVDTEIKIKTLPNHEVQLTISKANTASFSVIENFKKNSDEYGDVMFTSSSDEQTFNIIIYLKKNNEKVIANNFTNPYILLDNVVGTPVYLELAPAWFEFIETPVNETNVSEESENQTIEAITIAESESEVLIENEEEAGSQITGSAVSGDKGFFSNKTIYYAVGIIALLIGFVVMKTMRKKLKFPKEIKDKKSNNSIKQKNEKPKTNQEMIPATNNSNNPKTNQEIITDAEEKIMQAQEDIRKIKNQDKIKEAKKKLIEDQERLIRLRQGKE